MSAGIATTRSQPASAWRRPLLAPVPATLILGLALCAPLLIGGMPPLTDLPNHMVRMMLLAGQLGGSAVASHYRVHWVFVPNLGMDLLVPPLLHVMSANAAAKLLVAFIVLGWMGGLGLLGRALHGRWSPWFLTAAFTAWNGGLLGGLINFCLATMLAFWAAGAWLLLRQRATSPWGLAGLAALALPFGLVLFVAHLFGAFVFAAFLGADALVRAWRVRAAPAATRDRTRRLAAALLPPLPAALMLAVLYAATKVLTVGGATYHESLGLLLHSISAAWFSYPVLLGAFTGLVLIAVLLRAASTGGVAVAPAGVLVLLGAVVLGLAMPFEEHGLRYINVRFQILAGVLLSVVFMPRFPGRAAARLAAAALGALLVVRMAVMLIAWSRAGAYLADVRWILDQVPPQARMGEVRLRDVPPDLSPWLIDLTWAADYNFPVYIAATSNHFVPALFDSPGQQPLEALPAEEAAEAAMAAIRAAVVGEPADLPIDTALRSFDEIIAAGAWAEPPATLLGGRLARVAMRPGIALYKVVPPP
jgi:hypothetical protein